MARGWQPSADDARALRIAVSRTCASWGAQIDRDDLGQELLIALWQTDGKRSPGAASTQWLLNRRAVDHIRATRGRSGARDDAQAFVPLPDDALDDDDEGTRLPEVLIDRDTPADWVGLRRALAALSADEVATLQEMVGYATPWRLNRDHNLFQRAARAVRSLAA